MLGNTQLQTYFKNNNTVDIRPTASLEFNGNDYGDPYFYGTGDPGFISPLSLTPRSGAPAISTVQRGFPTTLTNSNSATLIKVTGSNKLAVASESSFRYSATTPSGRKRIKFFMMLKSDYQYQINSGETSIDESFSVTITARGLDSSNKVIRSETVTENVDVNSVNWEEVSILFANPDDYVTRVELNIYISPPARSKAALLVKDLYYSVVSDYEVYVKNRLPLSEVFETNRPGEFMVDMPVAERPNVVIGDETYPQQCSPIHVCMSYALGPKYSPVQRSVTPYAGNPYSYYVSGTDENSKMAWAIYKNTIKTNKIVIKTNAIAFKPTSIQVKIMTSDGWSGDISGTVIPDEHGIVILYYNGTSWSSTPWPYASYPYINDNNFSSNIGNIMYNDGTSEKTGYVEIKGIYFYASLVGIINNDFSDYGSKPRLELIEVSPRLEVDVSNFIINSSTQQEVANENFVLPFSGITSNTLDLELSNIQLQNINTGSFVVPFSNISNSSKIKNIIKKGVKVKYGFKVDTANTAGQSQSSVSYIRTYTGYIDSWQESAETLSITCFDSVKTLQSTRTRPLYLNRKKFNESVFAVFDSIGFGEFYADELDKLKAFGRKNRINNLTSPNDIISQFWTVKEKSASETLNEICKVFHVGMYADNYGCIRFTSLHEYSTKYKNVTQGTSFSDYYIQDFSDSNSLSNIIAADVVESTKPESIVIKYSSPQPSLGQASDKDAEKRVIPRPFSREKVWTLNGSSEVVPYIQLADEGIQNASQQYIPYYPNLTNSVPRALSYNGYLLIDEEIVKYDGVEYIFIYTDGTGNQKKVVREIKSPEDVSASISEIFTNLNGRNIKYGQTGRLLNVSRGLFGTVAGRHVRTGPESISNWKMIKFTKSDGGYGGMSNVSRKTGSWAETLNGIKVVSKSDNELLFLYPSDDEDDSALLKNKKRMSTQIKLGDIPKNKDGYVGVGIGITHENNQLKSGLLVWIGVDANKEEQKGTVYVQQIKSDGKVETLVSKDQFNYSENLITETDNIEIFVSLNEDRDRCEVLIGGTSVFKKVVEKEDKNKKDKKKKVTKTKFPIRKLPKNSYFGMIASKFGIGVLGQMQFGASKDPEDLNDLDINNIDDDYQGHRTKRPDRTYFIGRNTLLDNIIYGQKIAGLNDASADNFVYTGAPVGRGIKIFDVEYDTYPVINTPQTVWNGYTYELSVFEEANLFSSKEPDDIG